MRFVVVDGVLTPSRHGGRGAWVHDLPDCLQQAKRRRGFARSLRTKVDDSVLDQLVSSYGQAQQPDWLNGAEKR